MPTFIISVGTCGAIHAMRLHSAYHARIATMRLKRTETAVWSIQTINSKQLGGKGEHLTCHCQVPSLDAILVLVMSRRMIGSIRVAAVHELSEVVGAKSEHAEEAQEVAELDGPSSQDRFGAHLGGIPCF